MSRYTADSRDRVYDAVDMLGLVERRVELTRKGHDSYFGLCPFHHESTPSFHVRPDEKHYNCFGCQVHGDPFDFIMETEGLGFKEAMEALADMFGVKLETEDEDPEQAARRERRDRLYSLLARAAVFYSRYLWEAREAQSARAYLLGRGFTEATLREFRVGYAPAAWDKLLIGSRQAGFTEEELIATGLVMRSRAKPGAVYDRFRKRIMFPAVDARGKVRGFGARAMAGDEKEMGFGKYVNTAENDIYHKREELFGIDLARATAARANRMILVEGYTDVMAFHQAGIRNVVAIMGTKFTVEQAAELERTVKVLELCLDADSAGQEAMLRAARIAEGRKLQLRVVPLPAGADPGDLILREGPQALKDLVAASVPFVVFRVERILDHDGVRTAEDKDRTIEELRPVLDELPESVLRDDLIRRSAAQLDLTESRLLELLGPRRGPSAGRSADASVPEDPWGGPDLWDGPSAEAWDGGEEAIDGVIAIPPGGRARPDGNGGRSGTGGQSGNGARSGAAASGAGSPALHTEREFLTLCVAIPHEGTPVLAAIDIDRLLSVDLMRRIAAYLATRLESPFADLPPDDGELSRAVADIVERAGQKHEVTPDHLEHARLALEFARVDRDIRRARAERTGAQTVLALEKAAIQAQIYAVTSRIEGTI